ncbi:hypothetical protein [Hartmannibacter diazotrophicus]|uniref:hypothetical protein n=1 Tax=Hartmannibacter diazotrophicus TaxID=1482074 RepID=UPI0012FD9BD1|nr:hypothetical protein [Hartmannibacter diazotrophicus]
MNRILGNPYVLGGVALLFLSLLATTLYYRGNSIAAEAESARLTEQNRSLIATNAQNARNVERLLDQADISNKLQAELAEKLKEVAAATEDARRTIKEIRSNDPKADEYLGTDIPDSLLSVVNRPARH